jgi:predicted membrane metal-binding protein
MATLILLAPAEVMGVSFQMSFSAVLALIVGYDARARCSRASRGTGHGAGACSATWSRSR